MLELKNISKIYKTSKGIETHALKNVNLKFPKQGMVFVLGKSGSGKSTLLNIIGGLDQANSGEVIINTKSTKDFTQSDYDAYRNTYVGFIFQEFNLMEEYTIEKNIALALQLQQKEADPAKINELLEKLDLKGYATRYPNELSGGQKQRIAIARALVKEPEILMADEPTGALDSSTGNEIFTILKELSKEKLVIVVSHDQESAKQYADRIIEFKDGEVLVDSKPEVESTDDVFTSIRSHLPLKDSIKLGVSCLGHKKIRMVFTILLTSFALIMLGLSDAVGNFNEVNVQRQAMQDYSSNLVGVRKQFVNEQGYSYSDPYVMDVLMPSDVAAIMNETNKKYATVYQSETPHTYSTIGVNSDNLTLFDQAINTLNVTEMDDFEVLGLNDVEGSFPKNYEEVAISSYLADIMIAHGVVDKDGKTSFPASYGDILNKVKVKVLDSWITVSGIVKQDYSEYKTLKTKKINDISGEDEKNRRELEALANLHSNKLFVKTGYVDSFKLAKSNMLSMNVNISLMEENIDVEEMGFYSNMMNSIAYPQEAITYFDGTGVQSKAELATNEIIINIDTLSQVNDYRFYEESFSKKSDSDKEKEIVEAAKRVIGKTRILKVTDKYGVTGLFEQKVTIIGVQLPSDYNNIFGNNAQTYVNKELIEPHISEVNYKGELLFDATGEETALLEAFPLNEEYFAHTVSSADVKIVDNFAQFATKVFLYASIAFFIFAAMLMMNFIIVSITYRKKEIGILRAIGARSVDVLKIFVWEGISIALISYVVTALGLFAIATYTNNLAAQEVNLLITPVILTLRQPVLLLLTVSAVAFIACFVPVVKVARQKPIDAIKK